MPMNPALLYAEDEPILRPSQMSRTELLSLIELLKSNYKIEVNNKGMLIKYSLRLEKTIECFKREEK